MVKLTPELIEQCYQFTNAVRDRELDLRGKIVQFCKTLNYRPLNMMDLPQESEA